MVKGGLLTSVCVEAAVPCRQSLLEGGLGHAGSRALFLVWVGVVKILEIGSDNRSYAASIVLVLSGPL